MRERGEKEKKSSHHNNKTNMGIFTDHLPLLRKICRGLVTVHFFLGFAMTAMGFGLIEAPEDLQQITKKVLLYVFQNILYLENYLKI